MKGAGLQFLSETPLFVELSSDELQHLETLCEEKRYKRNAILFFEEDTGSYMYVVKTGRVKVSQVVPSSKGMTITFHDAGDYCGQLSLIGGETASATVKAVVPLPSWPSKIVGSIHSYRIPRSRKYGCATSSVIFGKPGPGRDAQFPQRQRSRSGCAVPSVPAQGGPYD